MATNLNYFKSFDRTVAYTMQVDTWPTSVRSGEKLHIYVYVLRTYQPT